MFTKISQGYFLIASLLLLITGCKKEEYSFGDLKAPTDLAVTTTIAGVTATSPDGNGSGAVKITATSKNALTYNVDFGDGTTKVVPEGDITYRFTTPGVNTYTITVNAIGTGGSISTLSKQVKVFVAFEIPPAMTAALTGGSSKVWITSKDSVGHFGVGNISLFTPNFYAAPPNTREACAYDDEITFALGANNAITMNVNNKGTSFSIGASTNFYGFGGGDGCLPINTGGTKTLSFMNATSGSPADKSSQIQFTVPGNGIINFGTGGTSYEIMRYDATSIILRNVGADGNAWYQMLTVKP